MKAPLSLALLAGFSLSFAQLTGPKITVNMSSGKSFVIQTDSKGSPKTVKRIVELVNAKFYSGIKFHRVEDWVVQWGDPRSRNDGSRKDGSGKGIPFERSPIEFRRGVVGIASTGAGVGGDSQLFVLTKDAPHLNNDYAVLGKVVKGMEVIDKLKVGDTVKSMIVSGAVAPKKPIKKK
jgi:peptidyl-prolyl cis-trans isomerase B (cyclophilin B)